MNKSGKIKCAVLAAVAPPVLAVAVWGAGWLWSLRDAGVPAPAMAALVPERVSAPGRPVTAELTLRLPLWRRVRSVTAEPGTGSVLSGTAGPYNFYKGIKRNTLSKVRRHTMCSHGKYVYIMFALFHSFCQHNITYGFVC